jgi:hypothetical protein
VSGDWRIRIGKRIEHLVVVGRGELDVQVRIDGQRIGRLPQASPSDSFTEIEFMRGGRRIVVVSMWEARRSDLIGPVTRAFVDGIDLDDGRSLTAFRLRRGDPEDNFIRYVQRMPFGFDHLPVWLWLALAVGMGLWFGLEGGLASGVFGVCVALIIVAWVEGMTELLTWLASHHDWDPVGRYCLALLLFFIWLPPTIFFVLGIGSKLRAQLALAQVRA